jgi:hypothetical protein
MMRFMRGPKKMKVLSTRVDEEVAARLIKAADEKEWTPSKYIEKLIRAHFGMDDVKSSKKKGRK